MSRTLRRAKQHIRQSKVNYVKEHSDKYHNDRFGWITTKRVRRKLTQTELEKNYKDRKNNPHYHQINSLGEVTGIYVGSHKTTRVPITLKEYLLKQSLERNSYTWDGRWSETASRTHFKESCKKYFRTQTRHQIYQMKKLLDPEDFNKSYITYKETKQLSWMH